MPNGEQDPCRFAADPGFGVRRGSEACPKSVFGGQAAPRAPETPHPAEMPPGSWNGVWAPGSCKTGKSGAADVRKASFEGAILPIWHAPDAWTRTR